MVKVENYSDIPDIDQTLIQKMKAYLPTDKIKEVTAAYDFAEDAHSGQKRLSGEPFFEHPKQTALFLADLKLDANTISAALLHDVIEDCDISYSQLSEEFGEDVAYLVDGVTKLTKTEIMGDGQFLETSNSDTSTEAESSLDDLAQAETLRKNGMKF